MIDIYHPTYDGYRNWIREARRQGLAWSEIELGRGENEEDLSNFLSGFVTMFFKPINVDEWKQIVQAVKKNEEESESIQMRSKSAMITDATQNNGSEIPTDEKSSWQLYRNHLKYKGLKETAVEEIEKSSVSILKRLNIDTTESGPVKGMVVGNVQSGKTANMAGLMAMAADHGWNMFIVLSGLVENLRKQTQERLISDLNHPGNISWMALENVDGNVPITSQTQNLILEGANHAHLYVCLKNKRRLEGLIDWIQKDPNKLKQMKVLVIDDEADQGSINTADVNSDERKAINRLIVNLVEGRSKKGTEKPVKPKSMNYISYTATPYANFLNEYSEDSLYPKSFIKTLTTVNEYFGPKEIFGVEGDEEFQGMDIVREISDGDYNEVKTLQKGEHNHLPDSLKDSICWFLCATASMKVNGYKKPISMMIHTSQKQDHHTKVANAIKSWIMSENPKDILKHCERVWKKETNRFTYQDFLNSYPKYSGDHDKMYGYLPFKKIEASIFKLIQDVTHIPLDNDQELDYHQNIHLCVDNCSNNGINDDGMFVRLAYPSDKKNKELNHATAFIVVGGTTLSRGLTIEGLVSTYFLRGTLQADTLMQMGRWFGYRHKYELYPRIWMTADTREKFEFLSNLEYELRGTLQQYSIGTADPSEYGPRVKNTPSVSWLGVTAKNKMQAALKVEMDFTGTNTQTIFFENDAKKLRSNINITEAFLSKLGDPEMSDLGNSYVYRDVPFNEIAEKFLRQFHFHQKTRTFSASEIEQFIEWIQKVTDDGKLDNWNVVVAGKGKVHTLAKGWEFDGSDKHVGKVTRTKKDVGSDENTFNIGVLRAPKDLLADVRKDNLSKEVREEINKSNHDVRRIREKDNLENTPLMLIYRIDKDSKTRNDSANGSRQDLDSPEDIIGISIRVPGINTTTGASYGGLQIDIPINRTKEKGGFEEE